MTTFGKEAEKVHACIAGQMVLSLLLCFFVFLFFSQLGGGSVINFGGAVLLGACGAGLPADS